MTHIFEEIKRKRDYQDLRWGKTNWSPLQWLPILGKQVGQVNADVLRMHFDNTDDETEEYRSRLIDVASVAIAMIESLDRNEYESIPVINTIKSN